jgi:hypothetical protein
MNKAWRLLAHGTRAIKANNPPPHAHFKRDKNMLATTTPEVRTTAYAQELLNRLPRRRSMSSHYAQDLLCEMPVANANFIASIRRCSRVTKTIRAKLTGGLELSIQLPTPTYDVGHKYLHSHLKPGWTKVKVIQAFRNLWLKAETEIKLNNLRQEVYALANDATPAPFPDLVNLFCEKVFAEEKSSGRTSSYRDMTEEDCAHWKKWLQDYIASK